MFLRSGRRRGRSSQSVDPFQDVSEQSVGYGDLRHLERDVPAMSDDLGTDLHQLLADRGQRPMFDFFRQRQRPHEVGEVVRQGMKLKPDLVVAELAARQPGPLDGVLGSP